MMSYSASMNGSALLVIDVQAGMFDERMVPAIHAPQDLLGAVSRLIGAARSASIPVIFVQHCAPAGQLLAEGTETWKIHPLISPEPSDSVVLKRAKSAFVETDLQDLLERRGIDTVIACGLQSEHCVSNTSISALELGLNVYVAGDAHSTCSTDDDDASVIIDRQNALLADLGARVRATASIADLFAAG